MKKWLIVISSVLIWSSCLETDVLPLSELDPYQNKIVVNAVLTTNNTVEIQITNSTSSGSTTLPQIMDNATVSLSKNNVNQTVSYSPAKKMYESGAVPAAGDLFLLDVRADGYVSVVSQATIPASIMATSSLTPNGGKDTSGILSDLVGVNFTDDGNQTNFYRINFFYYNTTLAEFIPMSFGLNDPAITEFNSLKLNDGSLIFNDELFNGQEKTLSTVAPFGLVISNPGDKYMIQLESINEDLYRYFITLQRAKDAKGSDFSNAFNSAAVIHSNVQRGIGIFGASYRHQDTLR
ncbi:MAG: DUF4249 domain-containing protein [Bacteroidia bacterium]